MKKHGFTLVELLAVIAILSIVAIITVPVVINYINNSKEISNDDSLSMYLKAVDNSILKRRLDNNVVSDGTYTIQNDGNICLCNNNACLSHNCNDNNKVNIKLKNIPSISGKVTIAEEEITCYNIVLNGKPYEKSC